MAKKKPNILWFCTDQQRWDTIHSLGNQHINTPNLDQLVTKGVAFTRTYTQSTICTPSRASFMTGRYPATHHVHRNGANYFPNNEILISKILSDAGYHCGLIGKLHLSQACNMIEKRPDDGYDEFYYSHHPYPDGPEPHDYAHWLEEKNVDINELYEGVKGHCGTGVPEAYHQTTWASERTQKFIIDNQKTPWFLNINIFDPHPPFDPPQKYLNHYNLEEIPQPLFKESDLEHQKLFTDIDQQDKKPANIFKLAKNKNDEQNSEGPTHSSPPPGNYDPRLVKACYFASIELIDYHLGKIIDKLEETDQLSNTIIIFTSDHGELLGDHGLLYKGCRFYEGLVHVPLIISWPDNFKEDLRSEALVELVDITPTLLEATGLKIPDFIQGKSLYPILTGEIKPSYHKSHVICEYNDALNLPDGTHGSMYFDGHYKSIVYHDHDLGEIFDLKNDPGEYNNLWYNSDYSDLKSKLLLKHFDAMMATSSPGIKRTGNY